MKRLAAVLASPTIIALGQTHLAHADPASSEQVVFTQWSGYSQVGLSEIARPDGSGVYEESVHRAVTSVDVTNLTDGTIDVRAVDSGGKTVNGYDATVSKGKTHHFHLADINAVASFVETIAGMVGGQQR